ncbi:MAG: class I SAM-dependent methyltransferase [Thermodesulfobacteriota bacterium]
MINLKGLSFKKSSEYMLGAWKNRKRSKFLEILPKNSIGVELGVFKGDFSKKILEIVQPEKLYLVDPWWLLGKKTWRFSLINRSVISGYVNVVKKFENELVDGKVEIKVGFSKDVLAEFPDNYLDWAYIDSSHFYKETKEELEILKDKVKDQGYISGHDWEPDPLKKHHGVYKAVNEFIKENSYDIEYLDEATQWCIRKK